MTKQIIFFTLFLWPQVSSSQIYFPLSVGNWWHFSEYSPNIFCEGIIYIPPKVKKDTIIAGKKYADFQSHTVLGDRFIRQEFNRVFALEAAEGHEYVFFDFSANVGDTVSVRDLGSKVIIASGPMTFTQYDTTVKPSGNIITWKIRDSIGVVTISEGYCIAMLDSANINGKAVKLTTVGSSVALQPSLTPMLEQNYPNPFNPLTSIRFYLPMDQEAKLEIFNPSGQRIAILLDNNLKAGWHTVQWDGSTCASGLYLYRLQAGSVVITRGLSLVK